MKQRGQLSCGVNVGLAGFSAPDDKGNWTGLDVDYCRAIAAAVLGDASKVRYVATTAKERFTALQSGEVDVLSRNTTWTLQRDSALGLSFVGVNYYDGQGFMVKKSVNVKSAKELDGATVCVQTRHHHRAQPRRLLPVQQADLQAGRVREGRRGAQGLSGRPLRRLHHRRVGPLFGAPADGQARRPRRAARDHLQGAARAGRAPGRRPVVHDRQVGALRPAQCRGSRRHAGQRRSRCWAPPIPRSSACSARKATSARASASTTTGPSTSIKQVGNYGEIFERNVGPGSRLKIARGLQQSLEQGRPAVRARRSADAAAAGR